ncbi:MAG: tRNA-dihydrouridine synthase family protein, partial [bacterium]|nr:tRNA-dihydrouridine synthase family protein [bacterium]
TEMISAEGLRRKQTRTLAMLETFDYKTPQFVQLFGAGPEELVEAAKFIENETNYSGIDINMGCPAPKIIRKGSGSALLQEPAKIAAIVRALKTNIKLPLTVKIRLGFNDVNVFEIADILQNEGADAVAVHFRTRADRYAGQAKWEYAAQLKERLNTVLIGNGDLLTVEEVKKRLEVVDAVMIGRGAVRNFLIFAELAGVADNYDNKWAVLRLIDLIEKYYPPKLRLPRLKAFARFIFFGRKGCKKIRQEVYTSTSYDQVREILNRPGLDTLLNKSIDIDYTDFPGPG